MQTSTFRIYYEDTDSGGVVYYANYLKFAERARTEWLRSLGFEQTKLASEQGILIVVRRCEVDFLKPARLDDEITIESQLQEISKVRMTMRQIIRRAEETLVELKVELACVSPSLKPTAWPAALIEKIKQ